MWSKTCFVGLDIDYVIYFGGYLYVPHNRDMDINMQMGLGMIFHFMLSKCITKKADQTCSTCSVFEIDQSHRKDCFIKVFSTLN